MKNGDVPPHLRVDDDGPDEPGGNPMQIVENMCEEIEGSHGGLDTDEAAEELIRRLDEAGGFDVPEYLAEALLDCMLELRHLTRRERGSHEINKKAIKKIDIGRN